jgi:hypothetical protein
MSILLVAAIWCLSMVSVLLGFWLGRSFRPKEDIVAIAQSVRAELPSGKGAVVALSDPELAELERIQTEAEKPNDPNDGIPGYPV